MLYQESSPTHSLRDAANDVPAAQRLLLDVLDTVREPLVVLDHELRVTNANLSFFRIFQVERQDAIGALFFSLSDGAWNVEPLRALVGGRLTTETVHGIEIDQTFPRVGRKIMLLNARLVSRTLAAPRLIVLAMEDITERRVVEGRLEEQRRELERSNAALDEFASVASHDLQEPLRKILSFGERLEASEELPADGDARRHLARMLSAAARMRRLINDLLDYSQVAVGGHPFAVTDLGGIAREVIADLETAVADAGARVEVGDLPVIHADAVQMRRLLQNLLGNAIKFHRKGTPPVVRLSASPLGKERFALTVADNGIGFSEHHADQIFGMFERLHGRAEYDGSGIGLAICRKIVERHGGTIVATGITGHGATFTVTLPITHAATELPS